MRSAILVWTKISQSTIPANALKHVEKSWNSPVTASVYQKLLADPHNTPIDAARLRAVASEHAGDWLHAVPITAVGLRLSDEAIRVSVGHRLRSTTCQPHTCICGVAVDAKGLHGLSCRKTSPCQIRHVQLNDIVLRAVKKAQYPAVKEPVELSRSDGKRPDGATLIPWTRGMPVAWGVTVPHNRIGRGKPSRRQQDGEVPRTGKDPPICANSN